MFVLQRYPPTGVADTGVAGGSGEGQAGASMITSKKNSDLSPRKSAMSDI